MKILARAILGPSRSESCVRTLNVSSAGCRARPRGNRCCICHPKRRRWGPAGRWFAMVGGRSQGFRPRRRRLSLRRGGIAVVAAVRSDSAAVSQCALLFLPHVSTVFRVEGFFISFSLPFSCARDNCVAISVADPCGLRNSQFLSATSAMMMMMDP